MDDLGSRMDGRTDGRMDGRLEIPPCVLQDIGPLGPLPKKALADWQKGDMMIAASLIWAGAAEKFEQSICKMTFKNHQNNSLRSRTKFDQKQKKDTEVKVWNNMQPMPKRSLRCPELRMLWLRAYSSALIAIFLA